MSSATASHLWSVLTVRAVIARTSLQGSDTRILLGSWLQA
jgi:hypothetical protein